MEHQKSMFRVDESSVFKVLGAYKVIIFLTEFQCPPELLGTSWESGQNHTEIAQKSVEIDHRGGQKLCKRSVI